MSEIEEILKMKKIAVIGLSKDQSTPSHYVPKYMKEKGYKIIPVNPTAEEILCERCCKSLSEVQESIDVVNIFRPSNEVLQIVKEAIAKKAKAVWMQEGIKNEEAAREARKHGLLVVMDRCMMKEHTRKPSTYRTV
ncbi:MAG: CoA-binding protein [Candidatus Hydrothermarchaeota archaeon]|nr:CoA-binding protein [Candidatus Hydrothermarchaeota archaeon]